MSEYKPLPSTTGPPQPDTKPSFPITAPGARTLNGGGFGIARWAAATAKINIDHKPTDSKPMSLAEVVQAKVRMNRWEKMKRGLKKRYSTINVVSKERFCQYFSFKTLYEERCRVIKSLMLRFSISVLNMES